MVQDVPEEAQADYSNTIRKILITPMPTSTPTSTPTPTPTKRPIRKEEPEIQKHIETYWPEKEWENIPWVLDGENGGRDPSIDSPPNDNGTIDRGIFQINSGGL